MGNSNHAKIEKCLIDKNGIDLRKEFYKYPRDSEKGEYYRDIFIEQLANEIIKKDQPFKNKLFLEFIEIFETNKDDENFKTKHRIHYSNSFNRIDVEIQRKPSTDESQIHHVISRTVNFANQFTFISFTLNLLTSGLVEDNFLKMKKYTQKIEKNILKEIDLKLYEKSIDEMNSIIHSIKKSCEMAYALISEENSQNHRDELIEIIINVIQQCDLIFENIKSKKILFSFSYQFIENLYNFSIFHCSLLISCINEFKLFIYQESLKNYIKEYLQLFKEYLEQAKKIRSEQFSVIESNYLFGGFTKMIVGLNCIEQKLIDEFNSEEILNSSQSSMENGSISSNFNANVTKLYNNYKDSNPNFFEMKVILEKLKAAVRKYLSGIFDIFENKHTERLNEILEKCN